MDVMVIPRLSPLKTRGFWLTTLERSVRKLPNLREDMVTRVEVKEWRETTKISSKLRKRDVEASKTEMMLVVNWTGDVESCEKHT